jgi:branched-chain amino acid transport system substrate-binding protein
LPRFPSPRVAALSFILIPALGLSGCVVPTVPVTPLPPQAPVADVPPPPPPPAATAAPPHEHLVDTTGKIDVALLVPLSGPPEMTRLGHDLLDAGQLAVIELGDDNLVLTPKDTRASPAGAADAARRAIAEGAKLLVGPLTAAEVEAVQPLAQAAGINILAFSNVTKVAGGNVFIMGFLPQQEARRVALYAQSTGLDHLAVLAPSNDYGQLAADSFKTAGDAAGIKIDPVEYYAPGLGDLHAVVKHIAASGKFSFTAVFVPEPDQGRLRTIAAALPAAEIDPTKVRLLGTSRWDAPSLGQEPSLVGGWYAGPLPDARANFEQHFAAAYGHTPQRLATLAYDAVGVAAVLERTPGADFSAKALENPSGFAGADGIFRLLPDGTAERGLAVLQVEHNGVTVVSPAPESFEPVGQ